MQPQTSTYPKRHILEQLREIPRHNAFKLQIVQRWLIYSYSLGCFYIGIYICRGRVKLSLCPRRHLNIVGPRFVHIGSD